jgi:hypothetical protein
MLAVHDSTAVANAVPCTLMPVLNSRLPVVLVRLHLLQGLQAAYQHLRAW